MHVKRVYTDCGIGEFSPTSIYEPRLNDLNHHSVSNGIYNCPHKKGHLTKANAQYSQDLTQFGIEANLF